MTCQEALVQETFLVFCILVCFVYSVAIYVFLKCRKIANNVKFWILHALVTNLILAVFIFISNVINAVDKESYRLYRRYSNACGRFGGHTSLLMMSAMGIDRLLSLQFNIRYHLYVSRRRIKIYALILYIVGGLSVVPSFIGEEISCHYIRAMVTTYYQGWVSVSMFSIFTTLNVVVYTVVGIVAIKKRNVRATGAFVRRNDYYRFLKITAKSFLVVLLYLILILPISVYQIFLLATDDKYPQSAQHSGSRTIILFFILLPFVFVANYQESRYRFLRLLCNCNKRYKDKLIRKFKQRYATYEIYTVERRINTEV